LDTPDELIEAFTTAVATTLREMAGVEVVVRGTFRAAGGEGLPDLSIALRLEADTDGLLILSFPSGTAAALTRRVLAGVGGGMEAGGPDEAMIRDCAAELVNVTAGQAKALLFGTPHHFTLSTPTVLTAGSRGAPAGRWVVGFDTDAGPFTLHLSPPRAAAGAGGAGESSFTGPGG
jgi:CheY-specific phosphatase CheX